MTRRYYSYGGLILILLAFVLFFVASKEASYETVVSRHKGTVLSKGIRTVQRNKFYGVTYRVAVQGRTIEREGDIGSQKAWDAVRIGDEIDVESIGVTPGETRLAAERTASSTAYRWISAAMAVGGVVLLGLRFRRGAGA